MPNEMQKPLNEVLVDDYVILHNPHIKKDILMLVTRVTKTKVVCDKHQFLIKNGKSIYADKYNFSHISHATKKQIVAIQNIYRKTRYAGVLKEVIDILELQKLEEIMDLLGLPKE